MSDKLKTTPSAATMAVIQAELRDVRESLAKLTESLRPAPDPEPDEGETERRSDPQGEIETVQCHLKCLAGLCFTIGDNHDDEAVSQAFHAIGNAIEAEHDRADDVVKMLIAERKAERSAAS